MYRYAYLLGSSIFFALWIPIFILRKDLRRQVLFMSVLGTFLGVSFEYLVWTVDWWRPETITGTRVGIEDAILSFTNCGLGAVLYEVVFKKKSRSLRKDSVIKKFFEKRRWLLWTPLAVPIVIGSAAFWVFGWHSFSATLISCLIGAGLIFLLRQDLLLNAIFGGLAMVLVTLPVYEIMIFLFPGIVEKLWLLDNLSGILVWRIPVEDLLFYFAVGAFLAPLYEFVFEKQLVKTSS